MNKDFASAENHADQVFDYLTEELLEGPSPPDLTARIVAAWKDQSPAHKSSTQTDAAKKPGGAGPLVTAELVADASDNRALSQQRKHNATDAPSDHGSNSQVVSSDAVHLQKSRNRTRSKRSGGALMAGMAVVAATLLGIAFLQFRGTWSSPESIAQEAEQPGAPARDTAKNSEIRIPSNLASPSDLASETPDGNPAVAEPPAESDTDMNDLPFDLSTGPRLASDDANQVRSADQLAALSDDEIVGRLDSMLSQMWRDLDVVPTSQLPRPVLQQKLRAAIQGIVSAESDANAGAQDDALTVTERLAMARSVTDSSVASRHLANLIASKWTLRDRPLNDQGVQELAAFLESRLSEASPWSETVEIVLGGDLGEADQPAADLYFSALANSGQNHRLVRSVGANFLNLNLACSRCHDAQSQLASAAAADQREFGAQADYWSLLSLLKGISLDRATNRAQDQQLVQFGGSRSPSLFFETPNGQMRAAQPKLPDGRDWQDLNQPTPRKALASWVAQSRELDQSTVNQIWQLVIGQRLVPQTARVDVVALEARRGILDFLAKQFRAHNGDVRSLATWIASSEAIGRAAHTLDSSTWLTASQEDLQALQLAEMVFAAQPSLGKANARSLERSLAAVVQWDQADANQRVLAQAAPGQIVRPNSVPRSSKPLPLGLALHEGNPTTAEDAYIARIVRNEQLDWEQQVNHIVLLSEREVANNRIVQQISRVRDQIGSPQLALQKLLWSVKNCSSL